MAERAATASVQSAVRPLWRTPVDLLTPLTLVFVLLYVIPPRIVLPGIKYFGRPGIILLLGMGVCWIIVRLMPGSRPARQPMKWALGLWVLAGVSSYIGGLSRGLNGVEVNGTYRYMAATSALLFVAVLVMDGIHSRARLDTLLVRILWCASFLAGVGALQFLFRIDITPHLTLPGLQPYAALIGQGSRGEGAAAFPRVAGTAGHFIEYGVLLSMLLPLALHYALHPVGEWHTRWRWTPPLMLAMCIPFSLSRSAAIALAIALLITILGWSGRRQLTLVAAIGAGAVLFVVLKPGLLSAFYDLFANAGDDNSIAGRTSDYDITLDLWRERPLLGRGAGTFVPELYRLLDNQWLGSLVSTGIIGVTCLAIVFLTGFRLSLATRSQAADPATANLAMALAAAIAVAVASSFTFDSLFFTTFAITTFALLGASGALWRFNNDALVEAGYRGHATWGDRWRLLAAARRGYDPAPGEYVNDVQPVVKGREPHTPMVPAQFGPSASSARGGQ